MSIGNYLDKINEFELLGIPFGAGAYFTVASSLSDAVIELLNHFLPVPPIATGTAAAWLFKRKVVSDFLGDYGSLYASIASVETAINDQFHLKERLDEMLGHIDSEVTGHVAEIQSNSSEVTVPSTASSASKTVSGLGEGSTDSAPEISNNLVNAYLNQKKVI